MYKISIKPNAIDITLNELTNKIQQYTCSSDRNKKTSSREFMTTTDFLRDQITEMANEISYETSDSYIKCLENVKQEISDAILNGIIKIDEKNGIKTVPMSSLANAHMNNFITVEQKPELGRSNSHLEHQILKNQRELNQAGQFKTQEKQDVKSKPKTSIIHKSRINALDEVIDRAINECSSNNTATVFLALRELALSETLPFTGDVEKDSLLYTNDNNDVVPFTRDALKQRLIRLKKFTDKVQLVS